MTQKKIGDNLYVFADEAYEITQDTTATVIYVQEEYVAAFKEENESLASKIKPINYKTMTVTKQPWADYIDVDDPTGAAEPTGDAEPTGSTAEVEVEETGASGATGEG